MASTNSTIDGMGFEEINQAGDMPANMWITGSVIADSFVSGTTVYGTTGNFVTANATTGSIATLRNTNIVNVGSISDSDGRHRSSLLGSATSNVWGGFMQAGSFTTSAGSIGFIKLGTPYTSATSYYVNATATGSATGFGLSYVSGTRHISGVNFVGAAALRYDWVAIGN